MLGHYALAKFLIEDCGCKPDSSDADLVLYSGNLSLLKYLWGLRDLHKLSSLQCTTMLPYVYIGSIEAINFIQSQIVGFEAINRRNLVKSVRTGNARIVKYAHETNEKKSSSIQRIKRAYYPDDVLLPHVFACPDEKVLRYLLAHDLCQHFYVPGIEFDPIVKLARHAYLTGNVEIIRMLRKKFNFITSSKHLKSATLSGNLDALLDCLHEIKLEPSALSQLPLKDRYKLVYNAIKSGKLDMLNFILAKSDVSLPEYCNFCVDYHYWERPLYTAVTSGNLKMIELIHSAQIHSRNQNDVDQINIMTNKNITLLKMLTLKVRSIFPLVTKDIISDDRISLIFAYHLLGEVEAKEKKDLLAAIKKSLLQIKNFQSTQHINVEEFVLSFISYLIEEHGLSISQEITNQVINENTRSTLRH